MKSTAKHFPARLDCLTQVLAYVSAAGADAGLRAEECARVELVIEELFTNTVDHGYANSRGGVDPGVRISVLTAATGLEVVYEDAAPPFDPTAQAGDSAAQRVARGAIGGLGSVLIRSLPSKVTYGRQGELNRTVLCFDRRDAARP